LLRLDAIAGIIITVSNFIGGIVIHTVQSDLNGGVWKALKPSFGKLTIGDGLVVRFLLLLISVCVRDMLPVMEVIQLW